MVGRRWFMAGGAHFVSFPDLLAKVYLAKTLTAFGKTLVPRGVIGPIYTYFEPNYLNFHSSLSYS